MRAGQVVLPSHNAQQSRVATVVQITSVQYFHFPVLVYPPFKTRCAEACLHLHAGKCVLSRPIQRRTHALPVPDCYTLNLITFAHGASVDLFART